MPSKEVQCSFLIVLELIKLWGLLKNPGNVRYVLYINFYVLLSFAFHLQKNFYDVHDDTHVFFLFQKDFDIFHEHLFAFYSFLL